MAVLLTGLARLVSYNQLLKNIFFFSFYIYWMAFTWKKGLGELEEKSKSQNKT